jgi:hypothetical protein
MQSPSQHLHPAAHADSPSTICVLRTPPPVQHQHMIPHRQPRISLSS